jgi:hypothetical protein
MITWARARAMCRDSSNVCAAIAANQPAAKAALAMAIADIPGLAAALGGGGGAIAIADVTGLQAELDSKAGILAYPDWNVDSFKFPHRAFAIGNGVTTEGMATLYSSAGVANKTGGFELDMKDWVGGMSFGGLLTAGGRLPVAVYGTVLGLEFNATPYVGTHALLTDATGELAVAAGTAAQYYRGDKTWQTLNAAAVGLANVNNTSDANKPVSTAQATALALKADLASPVLTGIPAVPTAAVGTNTTQAASTAFVAAAVASLLNSAPGALDTLRELADAIGDDPNYAATVTGLLANKQPLDSDLTAIAALTTTAFGRSFLDRADAAAARTLIGLGTAALNATGDFQAASALLTAYAGAPWAAGVQVPTLTAANTIALKTVGQAAGNLLDKAAGDALYQPSDADLTAIAALTTTAYGRALLTLADAAALTAALNAATGALQGAMSAQDKTRLDAVHNTYQTLIDSSGSHTALRAAGTYGFGQGDPLAITGVGTLYPLNVLFIDSADYPARGSLAAKLRVRVNVACNDVAPGGNYTFGLHPVTRPATSGAAGVGIFTIGAAVAGSTVAVNTPAADSHTNAVGADFALPANGFYVLGMVSSGAVAASAHMLLSAALQMHYA